MNRSSRRLRTAISYPPELRRRAVRMVAEVHVPPYPAPGTLSDANPPLLPASDHDDAFPQGSGQAEQRERVKAAAVTRGAAAWHGR